MYQGGLLYSYRVVVRGIVVEVQSGVAPENHTRNVVGYVLVLLESVALI